MHCHKVEERADVKQVRAIAALPAVGWDAVSLRTENLNDPDIGPILQEVETGERSEWKDIADRSPTYKIHRAQWNSPAVTHDILERNWESTNGRSKIAQRVIPRSRVKDVPIELNGGSSGGYLSQ
jgi:hypothetical protein